MATSISSSQVLPLPWRVGPNVLWRNNGNSTFTEWTGPTGLAGTAESAGAILSDINNDRAVDLVVTGHGASPTIFENQREGAFRQIALYEDSSLPATRGVSTFDFDKDGWMDVAVTHAGCSGPHSVEKCPRQALRARLSTDGECYRRLGTHADRFRQ